MPDRGKERILTGVDWCNLTSTPCPESGGGGCGIRRWLRAFHGELREKEARRLKGLARTDEERYWNICFKS